MKTFQFLYLLLTAFLLGSCRQDPAPEMAPDYLFEAGGQQVISSLINNKKGTVLMLYGNALARRAASGKLVPLLPGAKYTLVSWKQKPMPGWYGTNISAEIYSVETLGIPALMNKPAKLTYQFSPGPGFPKDGKRPAEQERIRLITTLPAAVQP